MEAIRAILAETPKARRRHVQSLLQGAAIAFTSVDGPCEFHLHSNLHGPAHHPALFNLGRISLGAGLAFRALKRGNLVPHRRILASRLVRRFLRRSAECDEALVRTKSPGPHNFHEGGRQGILKRSWCSPCKAYQTCRDCFHRVVLGGPS